MPLNTIAFPIGHFPVGSFPIRHWQLPPVVYSNYLIHPPSYILAKFLIAEDKVDSIDEVDYEWPIYVSSLPDVKENSLCSYDTFPIINSDIRIGLNNINYGIQLVLRSNDYTIGSDKAKLLYDYLKNINNDTIEIEDSNYIIKNINFTTGINYLGNDELRRNIFSLNVMSNMSAITYE